MIKKILPLLLILALLLSSCTSTETPTADNCTVAAPESYGYNFVLFDSDGDGIKDDIAELTCLGMSGGYGSFRLAVFISGAKSYQKVFDSEQYEMDESTYKKLSESIDGELMIDTFYSVEAMDTDGDGCDELVCCQYSWTEYHSNHIGEVVSIFKVGDNGIEIIDLRFEPQK